MNNNFFYEDGQGRILDEQGNDAVEWEEEVDPYNFGTLLTLSQYRAFQSRFPTEGIEELDVQMEELAEELSQAETSGKKYNVYSDSPNPENLEARYKWTNEWAINLDMNYLDNWVFVDETGFNINMRGPFARSMKGTPAIVETPTTRAITHTVLGAITAKDFIALEVREPLKPKKIKIAGGRNRKPPVGKKMPKGTVTGHYMRFVAKTLDEMDKFPEMKGFYIVMDNALIHTSQDITTMIEARGYKAVYLPPYSPEFNPIENFWLIVKGAVKRMTEVEHFDYNVFPPKRTVYKYNTKENAWDIQAANPVQEKSFLSHLERNGTVAFLYESRDLLDKAMEVIPLQRLYDEAEAEESGSLEDLLVRRLLHWFKNDFFVWVNNAPCDYCSNAQTQSIGLGTPNAEDLKYGAHTIELYQCTTCRQVTRFPRYNDPGKLLETRRGRCGEWANCFALCCRAIGADARIVYDTTDHVWTEVYSEYEQRWIHCDSCEEAWDKVYAYV
ncbi:hypothetical protein G6F38_009988 [Rhizopus arrhizus]|nr:hypothetical protein G6F38_009988 [Rhizopus arrhizus]